MMQTRNPSTIQPSAHAGLLGVWTALLCLLLVLWTPAKWSVQQQHLPMGEAQVFNGFPLHYTYLLPHHGLWMALQPDRHDPKMDPSADPAIWQPTLTQVQKFALVAARAVHEVWIDVACTISLFGKQQLDAP